MPPARAADSRAVDRTTPIDPQRALRGEVIGERGDIQIDRIPGRLARPDGALSGPPVVTLEDQDMHSRKRLLAATAMIAAFAVLGPSAAVASEGSRHGGNLHVTKECSAYAGAAGGYCTITSSNLRAIPAGSKVIYEQALAGSVLDTDITLDPPGKGAVAFGHVHLDLVANVGTAVFTGGTGKLAGFTASVAVTPDAGVPFGWRWDGTYRLSHDNFYLDKTCGPSSDAIADPLGYVCTVAHSSFRLFPAGTRVHYLSQAGNVVQARIEIPGGSTSGACVWSSDVNAVCTFTSGTGRLAHFRLKVVVTANADASVWYWNGTYRFTRHHHGHH